MFILQPIAPKQTTLDNAVYHHKLGPGNFTPIWTWIYPAARSSIVFEWKTSCFEMNLQSVYYRSLTVRKSEGSDIARKNIGGARFCAYHFAYSALCGIYFWHFMHTLDSLKFMEKSPLFFWIESWKRFRDGNQNLNLNTGWKRIYLLIFFWWSGEALVFRLYIIQLEGIKRQNVER